jgi:hypothetical protein
MPIELKSQPMHPSKGHLPTQLSLVGRAVVPVIAALIAITAVTAVIVVVIVDNFDFFGLVYAVRSRLLQLNFWWQLHALGPRRSSTVPVWVGHSWAMPGTGPRTRQAA